MELDYSGVMCYYRWNSRRDVIMDEQDKAEQQIKELKEQGYKSIYERNRDKQFKQAIQDYERRLNCPYR